MNMLLPIGVIIRNVLLPKNELNPQALQNMNTSHWFSMGVISINTGGTIFIEQH